MRSTRTLTYQVNAHSISNWYKGGGLSACRECYWWSIARKNRHTQKVSRSTHIHTHTPTHSLMYIYSEHHRLLKYLFSPVRIEKYTLFGSTRSIIYNNIRFSRSARSARTLRRFRVVDVGHSFVLLRKCSNNNMIDRITSTDTNICLSHNHAAEMVNVAHLRLHPAAHIPSGRNTVRQKSFIPFHHSTQEDGTI